MVLNKGGRKKALGQIITTIPLHKMDQEWSLDFVHDALAAS
jgi:hypothetical protein